MTGIEVLDIDQDAENSGYQNISAELVKESAAQEGQEMSIWHLLSIVTLLESIQTFNMVII